MSDVANLRIGLAEYVEEQAAWRSRKATEYPDDRRNATCAAALLHLAAVAGGIDTAGVRRIARVPRI